MGATYAPYIYIYIYIHGGTQEHRLNESSNTIKLTKHFEGEYITELKSDTNPPKIVLTARHGM